MAVVRARNTPPYGLFATAAVAAICAGAAIFCYVMYAKQSADLEAANKSLAQVATEQDIRQIRPSLMAGATGGTALQQADKKIKALTASLAEVQGKLDAVTTDRDQKATDLLRANASAKGASDRLAAAEKDAQASSASGQTTVASLQDQLKKLQDQLAAANAARDQAVADAEAKLSDAQKKSDQGARENVLLLEEARSTIVKNEAEIRELRSRLQVASGGKATVDVGEAAGKIIRVNNASGDVWITLNKSDRVKPGMSFSVYDPRTGVRFGSDEAAQGNGSLEVLEVGETSSLCRITRTTPGKSVQANDLIANLVFQADKGRVQHFVVFGDFDLDGDGKATAAERDRLVRLIVSWGGRVDDEVTSQTDYLVLGTKPATPTMIETADAAATGPDSVAAVRAKAQTRYDDLEMSAKRLAIPVLNENRFLSMIGYYSTTVVRY